MLEFIVGFVLGTVTTATIGVLWHRNIIQTKTAEWADFAESKIKEKAREAVDKLRGTF